MNVKMKKRLLDLAEIDAKNQRDPRFLDTMGFLVAKGLLGYNRDLPEKPNARLALRDVIWAGENVEPRILEVLPAAFARFERHFTIGAEPNKDEERLLEIRDGVRAKRTDLPDFHGIPYGKYKVWFDHLLPDRRTRPLSERKRMKAFRLRPEAIEKLAKISAARGVTETEVLEELIGRLA